MSIYIDTPQTFAMNVLPPLPKAPSRIASLLLGAFLFTPWKPAQAATFQVTTLADSGPGSLRQAILDANVTPDADQINFDSALQGTLALTGGEMPITGDVSLTGPGAAQLTLSGGNASRIFNISSGTVSISALTLSDGKVVGTTGANGAQGTPTNGTGSPGDTGGGAKGGAILNAGALTLTNVTLSGNTAQGGVGGRGGGVFTAYESRNPGGGNGGTGGNGMGGAIYNSGTLTLTDSQVQNNKAIGGAGGMGGNGIGFGSSGPSGTGGNGGNGYGGGIFNAGTLIQSTNVFSGNQALGGAGGPGVKNPFRPTLPASASGKSGTGTGPDIFETADQTPTIESLTLTPTVPIPGNTITAQAKVGGVPGVTPPVSYSWKRTRDGVTTTLDETTNKLVTSAATATFGDIFTVTVVATNGTHSTVPKTASVIIGPAPIVKSVTLSPKCPLIGESITATALADKIGTVTPTLSYTWTRVRGTVSTTLAGTNPTLLLDAQSITAGDTIRVTVLAKAAGISSAAVSASTIAISTPVVQTLTISPSPPVASNTLTATATTNKAGTLSPTLSYTWTRTRNGVVTTLDSKTASLPLSGIAVFGDKFTVTAMASYGDVKSAPKSTSVTVSEAPVIQSVTLTPSYAKIGATVTATTKVTYAGTVAPTLSYLWYCHRGGVYNYLDATGPTLKISAEDFEPGDRVQVWVTAQLGGLADYAFLEDTTIVTTPTIQSLTISPDAPIAGQTLTAKATATQSGITAPTLSYTWTRTRGGVTTTLDAKTATLPTTGDISTAGDIFTVTAVASYGDIASEPKTTSITIGPAPIIESLSLSPSTPYIGDTLTANAKISNAGLTAPTLFYVWTRTRNGSTTTLAQTGATLSATADSVAAGDIITVTATAAYGDLKSTPQSASVTINSPLVIQSLSLSPQKPSTNDSITAQATVSAPSGVTPTLSYVWTRTRKGVTTKLKETSNTLETIGDTASVGDLVTVNVVASDGDHHSEPKSASVTIANSPIGITDFSIKPREPYTFERMVATVKTIDLDKTPAFYTYTWTRNGVVTLTVPNSRNSQCIYDLNGQGRGDKNDLIEVTVSVSDSLTENATTATAKASAAVRNSIPVLSNLALSPQSPTPGQIVTSTCNWRDADQDKLTRIYAWKIGKKILVNEKGSRLDLSKYPTIKVGDIITVEARVSDGESFSKKLETSVTVIAAGPSTIQVAEPNPSAPSS